jgi:hypothetical protein
MNYRHALVPLIALLGVATGASAFGKAVSDLVSPEKRRSVVEQAQRLTRSPDPVPLPTDVPHPFNPPSFDQPDPEEIRAAAAANLRANPGVAPAGGPAAPGAPANAATPAGDREVLEKLAAMIPVSGTIFLGSEPLLISGRRNMKVGSHITVANTATGQDYDLELIAIDRTTFTLRYRNEEITRPIKSGKSP